MREEGAHRSAPPGPPEVAIEDVQALPAALQAIRDRDLGGEGVVPVVYRVNERLDLLAEPRWLQSGAARNPDVAGRGERE